MKIIEDLAGSRLTPETARLFMSRVAVQGHALEGCVFRMNLDVKAALENCGLSIVQTGASPSIHKLDKMAGIPIEIDLRHLSGCTEIVAPDGVVIAEMTNIAVMDGYEHFLPFKEN